MYTYYCYGLSVQSEMAIPELPLSTSADAEVTVRYGDVEELPTADDDIGTFALNRTPDSIHLWMNGIGGLIVERGSMITADPVDGAEQRGFRFLISGAGLGFLLHQRGIPSLHASAVALDGSAVAFIGWKGMGKSTTAASFHAAGYPVITDDLLPLYSRDGAVLAAPAFPHLKLLPTSVRAVFEDDPGNQPLIDPQGQKRICAVEGDFPGGFLPLQTVYVLDWCDGRDAAAPVIEQLPAREACIELLRHSFALRMFRADEATPAQLQWATDMTKRVAVRRLRRPRDLNRLRDVVAVVQRDVEQIQSLQKQPSEAGVSV